VPRPQDPAAQPGPGTDPNAPIQGSSKKRAEHKRDILREHTFRIVDGNMTYSTEYL
jgi:hypothetical protein